MNNIESAQARLHVEHIGSGPPLVMLHGLFGSLDNFGAVAKRLAEDFTVIRLDLPGHGHSGSLPELTLATLANAVLDTLRIEDIGACRLLGHSLGGKVAMAMAGATDELEIEQLVIVDIAPKAYPPHHQHILDALSAIDTATLGNRRDADEALKAAVPEAGVRAFLLKSLYRDDDEAWQWRFDLDGLNRDYAQLGKAPHLAQAIEAPTLFIRGGNSDFIQDDDIAVIDEYFVQHSMTTVPDAGHWPHAEQPDAFVTCCREFLRDGSR